MGFAPYPGKVSARTVRLFWATFVVVAVAVWAVAVPYLGNWYAFRAWVLLATGAYVVYWRSGLRAARRGSGGDE